MPDAPQTPSKSRLAAQLSALGLSETSGIDSATLAAEKIAMRDAEPLPLNLPPTMHQSRAKPIWQRPQWRIAAATIAAAAIAIVLFKPWEDGTPGWRVKGGSLVEVFADTGGNVIKLERGATLPNGARVRAQVTAGADSLAFGAFVDGSGQLLSDQESVWRDRLALKAGQKDFFPGSIELVGEASGETIVVVVCDAAVISPSAGELPPAIVEAIRSKQAGPSGCSVFFQSLR